MGRDLSRLLRPSSIAVIGGGAIIRFVIENCAKIGFEGPVWHVHPSKGAFARVEDLPQAPDVAFVGVNRMATLDVVRALRDMGTGGAVAYASGFSEALAELADGDHVQEQLLEAAGDMPLIGPNCYGFLNYLDGAALWPDQQGGMRCARGVAIITQSSNIAINLTMQRRGLPIAYLVTAGNQAQLGIAAIGEALLADPRVSALGMHIEGIGDLRAFEGLAAVARGLGKPIVALKAGQSEQARAATVSHTASLAGSSAGSAALFKRLGMAQVGTLSEMLETLKLLHVVGPLSSNRIASMSCSGGEASLMADRAVGRGIVYPALDAVQVEALGQALGPKVALANPLDYHTYIWADQAGMAKTYRAMMLGDLAMGLVVSDFPRADHCTAEDWEPVILAACEARETSGKPMGIVSSLPENMPEATAQRLASLGTVAFNGMDEAITAIEVGAWLGQARDTQAEVLLPDYPGDVHLLSEADAKVALAAHGVVCPKSRRCGFDGLAEAARFVGFPCVLKGEGVAHKTEAGAVALGLMSEDAVVAAAQSMDCSAFLVEEMITGGIAEVLIGVVRDGAHGFVLTLAAGGTLTEILQDSASLLVPASVDDVSNALTGLKIAPLFAGFRGGAAVSMEALLGAVMSVQDYVIAAQGSIEEVEINPLICTETRAVMADALIRCSVSGNEF